LIARLTSGMAICFGNGVNATVPAGILNHRSRGPKLKINSLLQSLAGCT